MDSEQGKRFVDLLNTIISERVKSAPLRPDQILSEAINREPHLWKSLQELFGLCVGLCLATSQAENFLRPAEDPQGWLDLPDYAAIPQVVRIDGTYLNLKTATLEQYRRFQEIFRARIESYAHPRRSPKLIKHDKRVLSQMRKLDRNVASYFAGNAAMTMGLAVEMYEASMKTPSRLRQKKAGKARHHIYETSTT